MQGDYDSTPRDADTDRQFEYGRHVGTRTPDLYRVNFEVTTLKPFYHLAFPHFPLLENSRKHPSFDGELMASSLARPSHGNSFRFADDPPRTQFASPMPFLDPEASIYEADDTARVAYLHPRQFPL